MADLGDWSIGVAQQSCCSLEAASQEVLVRRLPERSGELPRKVRRRPARLLGKVGHPQRLGIPPVRQVTGTKEVPSRWDSHPSILPRSHLTDERCGWSARHVASIRVAD